MNQEYVESELDRYSQVERSWLRSQRLSITRIPDEVVASAFVVRNAEKNPDKARWLVEYLVSSNIVNQAFNNV